MFIIKEKHINRKTLASMPERSTYYKKYNDVSDNIFKWMSVDKNGVVWER